MQAIRVCAVLSLLVSHQIFAQEPLTNALPGRTLIKLAPDYLRPVVYALNAPGQGNPGTLLALNATNGVVLNEIVVETGPTDFSITPSGDALYVINGGSRSISKVNLASFAVESSVPFTTPRTYNVLNPLYIAANNNGTVYFTDGAWGPEIYSLDYASETQTLILDTGGNQSHGAGALALSKNGDHLYIWQQYGWSAGVMSAPIVCYSIENNTLTALSSGSNQWRDPLGTPILLDGSEQSVFAKLQRVSATNAAVVLAQFPDSIYAISLDGTVAFGASAVYNATTGTVLTNLPFATTVQSLSGDQKRLFRYSQATASLVVVDMATIASVQGTTIMPTPVDGSAVPTPPSRLTWTPSPTALGYDVYFGSTAAEVAAATSGSASYLGRFTSTSATPGIALIPGHSYYWRVDAIGFTGTAIGPIWSFTVSPVAVTPTPILMNGIVGYKVRPVSLSLSGAGSMEWSCRVAVPGWLSVDASSGITPASVTVSFDSSTLTAGTHTNNLEFTMGGLKVNVPVTLSLAQLNVTKMAADRSRPYIYALQPPPLPGQPGQLLILNTQTGDLERILPIGTNPTDLCVHTAEDRLYIASWLENATYVVDLPTFSLQPPLHLGVDVYKINASVKGRIIIEGEDQWIGVSLINTADGSVIAGFPYPEREGDGESDASGTVYYHSDNNISNAHIHKFAVTSSSAVQVAASNEHPFGTRNLVLSADGRRLFWNRFVFDANLRELGGFGDEIFCCSSNGLVAFGAGRAYDTATRAAIFDLPYSSSIAVVDGRGDRYWSFDNASKTIKSIPLQVIQSPSIARQPQSSTNISIGANIYLSVSAMGLAPLSYQWSVADSKLDGATNYFLAIDHAKASDEGAYRVTISNQFGSVTSSIAQVTVIAPPTITQQPQSATIVAGNPLNLSVQATGTEPLRYRWFFEGSLLTNVITETLSVPQARLTDGGVYRVVITNVAGSITSSVAVVRVVPSAPTILAQPDSLTVAASSNAIFKVVATGGGLSYQWYHDEVPIHGATASECVISDAQEANAGSYRVHVANALGQATSASATLTVTPLAAYFITHPSGSSQVAGSELRLVGLAGGTRPISYQWQHDGHDIPGAVGSSYVIARLTATDAGAYVLLASNVLGTARSTVAQVEVLQPPTLLQPLSDLVVTRGSQVTLTIEEAGTGPLSFAWKRNGRFLAGTGASLVLPDIQKLQSGYYSVTVTNLYGSVSSTGRLSVVEAPCNPIAWGDNSAGQTSLPPGLHGIVGIAGGDYHTLVLNRNGHLAAWGFNGDAQLIPPVSSLPFVAIAAGAAHNLAITAAGTLVAWGRNDSGQCNVPAPASSYVLDIAAGDAHSLALLGNGTVVAWGDNSQGQSQVPTNLTVAVAVAAGRLHSLALLGNGTVQGWGYRAFGQTVPPASLTNATAIAAGYLHSVALRANGLVEAWGDDSFGQSHVPAGLSNVVAVAAGDFSTLALRSDGTIVGWGDNSMGQLEIPAGTSRFLAIGSGNYHSLALQLARPFISFQRLRGGLTLSWPETEILQQATSSAGPFVDVTGASIPFTNADLSLPSLFYRLRSR